MAVFLQKLYNIESSQFSILLKKKKPLLFSVGSISKRNFLRRKNIYILSDKKWVHSITFDNGLEFAEHKMIAQKLETKIFFTHPYCSWEKGQVENMNKLIRQYIPKNKAITKANTMNIRGIQYKVNRRPRKNLNYQKPFNVFYKFINKENCI